jgi:hypothetical protein
MNDYFEHMNNRDKSQPLTDAAKAWDRAELEGRLHPPAAPPDTRPRDPVYNKLIEFNIKATIGGKPLLDNFNPDPFK